MKPSFFLRFKKIGFLSFAVLLFSLACFFGLKFSGASSKIIFKKAGNLEYHLLFFPQKWFPFKKYPLVLLLHGVHQSPESILAQWAKEASKRRVMILAPQWIQAPEAAEDMDPAVENILNLVKNIESAYSVDPHRIFIAGISAGGARVQKLLEVAPEKWRGAIWMSFVPSLKWFQTVEKKNVPPIFFTYGRKDPYDQYALLIQGESVLNRKEMPVQLLVDPNAGHEYRSQWNQTVFDWILSNGRKSK